MTTYTYEEALESSTNYFNGDKLAAEVFLGKYALKNEKGELIEKTPKDMHKRIAKELARIEAKYPNALSEEEIFDLLDKFKYIVPQGSPMAGIGNNYQVMSLSNCYVIDSPKDSYSGIMYADTQLANLMKRRAGVGLDLSELRPKDAPVKNASGTTTGVGTFMERYSNTTREVGQCIAAGQKVLTNSGLKAIESVIPGVDKVWSKQGWVSVLEVKNNGIKNVYKVETSYGYKISTTLEHVFLNGTLEEKKLNELKIKDEICLIPGTLNVSNKKYVKLFTDVKRGYLDNIKLPNLLTEDFAYFLGYSYGDGYVTYKNTNEPIGLSLACSDSWINIKSKLNSVIKNCFNYDVKIQQGDGKLQKYNIYSKEIVSFLNENDILKQKADKIKMPEKIWQSPLSVQMSFISGYFDADGYASGKKKGYVFSSINKKFLDDVQTILMSAGIVSKFHFEDRSDKANWKDLWTLCIVGGSSQEKLFNLTSKFSIKINNCNFISKKDCILTPFISKTFDIKYNNFSYIPDNTQNLSVKTYERYIKESKRTDLPQVLVKDKIISIKDDGMSTTYDLVLEKEHLFWCEGYYVHNSGRRGANMQTLSIHHPEVETFLHIKKDLTKVTGANISVKITDEFMKAVIENKDYEQRWPVDSKTPVISRMVNAKKIWDQIIENAWSTAEPGVIFWDTVLKWTTPQAYATKGFEHISTNPCSELVLSANDSCRLLLINALSYVKDPFTNKATFDYDLFAKHAQIGQRFMDDIVDLELECIDKILNKIKSDPESEQIKKIEMDLWKDIRKNCEDGRRTGLGLTAIGDTLAALGLTYGSEASIEATEKIYKTLAIESYRSSVIMAKDRGVFPVYEYELEKDHPFINRIMNEDQELKELWIKHGRRNIGNLTTAPAGSVSILTQTSSGIEPVFLTHYKRRKKINPNDKNSRVDFVDQLGDKWQEFMVYHHGFKNWMEINNKTEENFNESPYFGATSNDVNWKQSVKLQAAAQKWIDHSISKTCNLPESATKELVSEVYMEAYKLGCKGFTIYRDGSRSGVLVSDTSKKEQKPSNSIPENHAPKRPQELPCDIHVMTVKGEKWTFFVGKLNNKPYEILGGLSKYVNIPKRIKEGKIVKHNGPNNPVARYDLHYDFEKGPEDETVLKDLVNIFENATEAAFTRTLSLSLRHGVPIQYIVEQVSKGSESDDDLFSFSKAVSRVLKTYIVDGTKASSSKKCPSCKEEGGLIYSEGCIGCKYCSYSKCS